MSMSGHLIKAVFRLRHHGRRVQNPATIPLATEFPPAFAQAYWGDASVAVCFFEAVHAAVRLRI
jgi:hypothetical protein